jgi:diguanylate cyclase (GGDEF)-like protein
MDCLELKHAQAGYIAQMVRTDRLQQLFRQSVLAVFGSYFAALMLCWLCWERFDHQVAMLWIGLLGASSLLRIAMFVVYFRTAESERTPQRWECTYWVTLVLSAGIWGGGAFALMPAQDLLTQVLVVLFTVGMSVSAVTCYSSYRYMTLAAIGLVLLPCTLWMLQQPTTMQLSLAVAVLVFSIFAIKATMSLADALDKAFRATREMEWAHRVSARAARIDELTGLNNRRAFFERAQQLYTQCRAEQRSLCAVMLDMDHFKLINDTYGHQVGDEVLQHMGKVIIQSFRATDVHGRLGGEEFAVLLPDTSLSDALQMTERLMATLRGLQIERARGITASLGVAACHDDDLDLHNLLHRADQALYRAKAQGRNRVCVAEAMASVPLAVDS